MPYASVAFVYAAGDRDVLGDAARAAVLVGSTEGASLGDTDGVASAGTGEVQLVSDASSRSERRMLPWTTV